MATFGLQSAGKLQENTDIKKVNSYLYRLEEQLKYMFANLDPEENYSEKARLVYVANSEKQSAMEIALDHISLSMVDKDEVVAAINLSDEGVKIKGDKISLEGVVTVNSYFSVGLDGSITARNGKFSGKITASEMESSSIKLGGSGEAGSLAVYDANDVEIGHWNKNGISLLRGIIDIRRGSAFGLYCDGTEFRFGDFVVNDNYGRQVIESSDSATGMSGIAPRPGFWYLWAGHTPAGTAFYVDDTGNTVATGHLYIGSGMMDVENEIRDLRSEIEGLSSGPSGGGSESGGPGV
jgi:hypothetical protein